MAKADDPERAKPREREAKLAQALRANLRRRKAAPDPKVDGTSDPGTAKRD